MKGDAPNQKLSSVHALRGLAALWVCLHHLTHTTEGPYFHELKLLNYLGARGGEGIAFFFVISGFILPFVLHRAEYEIRDFKIFVLKRLVRLEPAYFVSIAFALLISYMSTHSSLYKGAPFSVTLNQLFLHIGYMAEIFNVPWIIGIYWTLAIEFQYYLIIGLVFPYLVKDRKSALFVGGVFILAALIIPNKHYLVSRYLFLFFMGFASFKYYSGLSGKMALILSLVGGFIGGYFALGLVHMLAGLFAVGFILFFKYQNRCLNFLGNISYSLYLVHVPAGVKIIHLGLRFAHSEISQLAVVFAALATSFSVAFVLYLFVEKPTQVWASRITYKRESSIG